MVLSRDVSDFAAIYNLLGFDVDGSADSFTNLDAVNDIDAFAHSAAPIEFDACVTDLDAHTGSQDSAGCDLGGIVDSLFRSPPSANLDRASVANSDIPNTHRESRELSY